MTEQSPFDLEKTWGSFHDIFCVASNELPGKFRGPVELADFDVMLNFLRTMNNLIGKFVVPIIPEADLTIVDENHLMITDRQETLLRESGPNAAWPMVTTSEDIDSFLKTDLVAPLRLLFSLESDGKYATLFRTKGDPCPGRLWLEIPDTAMMMMQPLVEAFHTEPDNLPRPIPPGLDIPVETAEPDKHAQRSLRSLGVQDISTFLSEVKDQGRKIGYFKLPFEIHKWDNWSDRSTVSVTPLDVVVDSCQMAFDWAVVGGVMETDTTSRVLVGSSIGSWFVVTSDRADRLDVSPYKCRRGDIIPPAPVSLNLSVTDEFTIYPDKETLELELSSLPNTSSTENWPQASIPCGQDDIIYVAGKILDPALYGNALTGHTFWKASLAPIDGSDIGGNSLPITVPSTDVIAAGHSLLRHGMAIGARWQVSIRVDEDTYDSWQARIQDVQNLLFEKGITAEKILGL